jgi:hypothetical protein
MERRITRDLLASYLTCKYKGFLKRAGQEGIASDYEQMLTATRDRVRLQVIDKLVARHSETEIAKNIPLTASRLRQGPLFIVDATLEDECFSLS